MPDGLLTILLIILVVAIIWMVVKLIFKLTIQIFSCGCFLIVLIGAFLYFAGYLQITASF